MERASCTRISSAFLILLVRFLLQSSKFKPFRSLHRPAISLPWPGPLVFYSLASACTNDLSTVESTASTPLLLDLVLMLSTAPLDILSPYRLQCLSSYCGWGRDSQSTDRICTSFKFTSVYHSSTTYLVLPKICQSRAETQARKLTRCSRQTHPDLVSQSDPDRHLTLIHCHTSVSFCHYCADAGCHPAGISCIWSTVPIISPNRNLRMLSRKNAIDQAMLPIHDQ